MKTVTTALSFCLLLVLSIAGASLAHAQTTYSGDTSGASTWSRPDGCNADGTGCVAATSDGTATPFVVHVVIVHTPGDYTFTSTQDYDGLLVLYGEGESAFDSSAPLDNVMAYNDDDSGNVGTSAFTVTLSEGLYWLVTTGFADTSAGTFTNTISGPGLVFATDTSFRSRFAVNTTGNPTFNRPFCDGGDITQCALSGTGTATPFASYNITPSESGVYLIWSRSQNYDGLLVVYEGSWAPSSPLDNIVAYNDDSPRAFAALSCPDAQTTPCESEVLVELTAGVKYFVVTTGFENTGGTSELVIDGPVVSAVAVPTEAAIEVPDGYELSNAYPNPFNPQTQFTLALEQTQHVAVGVFDLLGRQVASLHDGMLATGKQHAFTFEASTLPSGIYLIMVRGETFAATRKVVLVK